MLTSPYLQHTFSSFCSISSQILLAFFWQHFSRLGVSSPHWWKFYWFLTCVRSFFRQLHESTCKQNIIASTMMCEDAFYFISCIQKNNFEEQFRLLTSVCIIHLSECLFPQLFFLKLELHSLICALDENLWEGIQDESCWEDLRNQKQCADMINTSCILSRRNTL